MGMERNCSIRKTEKTWNGRTLQKVGWEDEWEREKRGLIKERVRE